jgi:hypothetical protein
MVTGKMESGGCHVFDDLLISRTNESTVGIDDSCVKNTGRIGAPHTRYLSFRITIDFPTFITRKPASQFQVQNTENMQFNFLHTTVFLGIPIRLD